MQWKKLVGQLKPAAILIKQYGDKLAGKIHEKEVKNG